jgi:hypothetical protein
MCLLLFPVSGDGVLSPTGGSVGGRRASSIRIQRRRFLPWQRLPLPSASPEPTIVNLTAWALHLWRLPFSRQAMAFTSLSCVHGLFPPILACAGMEDTSSEDDGVATCAGSCMPLHSTLGVRLIGELPWCHRF